MSYYHRPMGDYATGGYGYPQGDPGLFGFLGKIIKPLWKKVVKPALGYAIGGAIIGEVLTPGTEVAVRDPQAPPGTVMPGGGGARAAGQFVGGAVAGYRGAVSTAGACPAGYHLRKDKRLPPKCVRNRRMNIANPRALRRGMRRVKGFEKLARRTISFTKRVRIKS